MTWSVQFEPDQAEKTTLIVNGHTWARGFDQAKQESWSWAASEGSQEVPLPSNIGNLKELHVVGIAKPVGQGVRVHFKWDGKEKQYMNFSKQEDKTFSY